MASETNFEFHRLAMVASPVVAQKADMSIMLARASLTNTILDSFSGNPLLDPFLLVVRGAYTTLANHGRPQVVRRHTWHDECLAECSKDSRCKAIHHVIMNDSHCKFLKEGSTKPVPVPVEGDCSRTFMIGFAPTVAK